MTKRERMHVWTCKEYWNSEFVRSYPDRLFVFGDNEVGWGVLGQACIRYEQNAVGIPTTIRPGKNSSDYWSDANYEHNCKILDTAIAKVLKKLRQRDTKTKQRLYTGLVLPQNQIGSGLARLPELAPRTYAYLETAMKNLKKSVFKIMQK
jgi:hypothetical protein